MLKRWFHRTVLSRRWLTFLVMGLAFFVFGAGTVNIFMLFKANAALIASYGWPSTGSYAISQKEPRTAPCGCWPSEAKQEVDSSGTTVA